MIELTLGWLKRHGVAEIGINLHYLGQQIADLLGDGSRFGLKITYSHEEELLGTAGGTKKLESLFTGHRFVVVYGDVLTDLDLGDMVSFHVGNRALVTIALSAVPNPHEKGIVEIDKIGRILGFVEKPAPGTARGNLANGGIYVVESEVLGWIPSSGYSDFGFDVFPSMLRKGMPMFGYVLRRGDYLLDIGSLEKYRQAGQDYAAGKVRV